MQNYWHRCLESGPSALAALLTPKILQDPAERHSIDQEEEAQAAAQEESGRDQLPAQAEREEGEAEVISFPFLSICLVAPPEQQ